MRKQLARMEERAVQDIKREQDDVCPPLAAEDANAREVARLERQAPARVTPASASVNFPEESQLNPSHNQHQNQNILDHHCMGCVDKWKQWRVDHPEAVAELEARICEKLQETAEKLPGAGCANPSS